MRARRVTRQAIVVTVLLGAAWLIAQDIRDFFVRDDGVAFYRERPWLLGVCVGVAIVIGVAWHVLQSRRKR